MSEELNLRHKVARIVGEAIWNANPRAANPKKLTVFDYADQILALVDEHTEAVASGRASQAWYEGSESHAP